MTSFNEKYKAMVESLYNRTVSRQLKWKLNDYNNPFVQIGNYSIIMENKEEADGSPYVLVSVYDLFGKFVENFSDNTLSEEKPSVSSFPTFWALMEDLINLARRQARGADSALDEIIRQLGPT